jgi:glycine/D-amino acid oxidase-like deaminating enzyme
VPVGSSILVTEPLERLARLPAAVRGEGLGDRRLTVHYMQITAEGRLAFGRGGGPIGPFGRVLPEHMHDERTLRSMLADLHRWWPELRTARITHAWSGPVDRAPGHLPFLGYMGDHGNILYASGLSGQGVGQCAFIGRVLGRMALGIEDEDTRSPLTWGPPAYLPPEPLRSVGGALVRAAVERVEEAEELHGLSLRLNPLFRRLIKVTVPQWLEPRRTAG